MLKVNEIYYSVQGESTAAGLPCVFVRLTYCNIRCSYCDTEYAFYGGEKREISDIVAEVASYNPRYVTVSGGEPLAQNTCRELLTALCDLNVEVSLETSGAMDISNIDPRVIRVMDLKTPASGEETKNRYSNIDLLTASDQLKFVICNREDYDWSIAKLAEFDLSERCEVLFSPVHGDLDPKDLAEWIIEDNLPVRMQIQLHKYLWQDAQGK